MAKFILSFALSQKQLDDRGYLEAFRQSACLMMQVSETCLDRDKALISYLVYKYAKHTKNMLTVQKTLD